MKKTLLQLIIFLFGVTVSAQTKKTFTVNPGEKIVEAIPITEIYTNAEFRLGTVALRNGTSAFVKLNYNSVFGEMQFINPQKGDTISIAEEKNIKFVAIEKDTFYFDEAWLQVIDGDSTIKIARKNHWKWSIRKSLEQWKYLVLRPSKHIRNLPGAST